MMYGACWKARPETCGSEARPVQPYGGRAYIRLSAEVTVLSIRPGSSLRSSSRATFLPEEETICSNRMSRDGRYYARVLTVFGLSGRRATESYGWFPAPACTGCRMAPGSATEKR